MRAAPPRPEKARDRSQPGAARRYAHDHPRRINLLILTGGGLFMATGYLAPRLRLNPDELNTPDFPDVGATVLALAVAVAVDLLLLAAFALHDRTQRGRIGGLDDPAALVPPVLRPFCWLVILPSLTGVAGLASRVADSRGPLRVDQRVDDNLAYRLHPLRPVFDGLTQLGSPAGVAVLSGLLAAGCLALRRRRAALLALAGPPLAGTLTEYALKPLIDRRSGHGFAFPSGHITGAVAVAATTALFLLPAGAFAGLPRPARLLLAACAAVLASVLPLGLITLRYHYATDVLAGAAVAVTVILIVALTLDAATRQRAITANQAPSPHPEQTQPPDADDAR